VAHFNCPGASLPCCSDSPPITPPLGSLSLSVSQWHTQLKPFQNPNGQRKWMSRRSSSRRRRRTKSPAGKTPNHPTSSHTHIFGLVLELGNLWFDYMNKKRLVGCFEFSERKKKKSFVLACGLKSSEDCVEKVRQFLREDFIIFLIKNYE
jgi:hypothetical protein